MLGKETGIVGESSSCERSCYKYMYVHHITHRRIADSTRSSQSLEESAVPQLSESVAPPPGINERKLMAKIDMRLLPVLCVLYLLAFLDRYVLLFAVGVC